MKYLMGCGHVTGTTLLKNGSPVCPICYEIEKGYDEIICEASGTMGLEGRKAISPQTPVSFRKIVDSSWDLPFFEHRPNEEYDVYYDGYYGFN